jgi:3-hydroxyisobutyrate dehydrogenase
MKVGVAGLGRMGAAIAKRLIEVGHEVTVWNRSPDKIEPLAAAGATSADTPGKLATNVDVVLTILTDAAAIDSVYSGPDGLLSGDVTGKLFIEMSTVRPETEVALDKKIRGAAATLVECPVGGTVGPALQGKLLGLAGGEKADFERARPILDQLCRRVDHVGPIGAGASMKLAINLPLAVFWQSLGEAYALCRHLGGDPKWLAELFADTSGGTNVLKARGSAVALAWADQDPGSATFDCDSIRKDLRTMVEEAKGRGFELPVAERVLSVFDEASQNGWGKRDGVELPSYWASRTA